MKNSLPTLVLLVCAGLLAALTACPAQAKIWRVDNNGGSPGDFTSLQAAFDTGSPVANNDTLYVNGSGTSYGDVYVNKRVYIFGPGYFLSQNPETQASPTAAAAGYIEFTTGSTGSLITGMTFTRMYINADNILVKRNYGSVSGYTTIHVAGGHSNVLLVQNYLVQGSYGRTVYVQSGCSNVLLSNNFLYNGYPVNGSSYAAVYSESSMTVTQNVVQQGWIIASNSTITNNILYDNSSGIDGSGNGVLNNLAPNTNIPSTNGNQQGVNMTNVFTLTGSDDGKWQLKTGSPAIGAGANGEDCGMYGGADPYVLSGMPAIPAIWFFAAPTSGSGASGLQVHLKAKSHN